MLFILNRDFEILSLASNDSEGTLNFFDDVLHSKLSSGVSTFEFTVSKNHNNSTFLQEGNYITFKNKKGKQLLFTIIQIDEDYYEKNVYCEDIGLDLLNETVGPAITDTAKSIAWYLESALHDSGWKIGVNEISTFVRTLTFDSYTNAIDRILNIVSSFDAEVDFTVDFDGNTIVNRYVNIYKMVGKETGIRLDADFNLISARRTVSIDNLVTGLYGIGSEIRDDINGTTSNVDFKDITYDDGRYYTWNGGVFDREANKTWSRYKGDAALTNGFIMDHYSYDTDSSQELFNRALSQLKKRNVPSVVYDVAVSELDVNLDIGDTISVVDNNFNPPLYLSARVLEVDESQTDKSKNNIKLGNYQVIKSTVDEEIKNVKNSISSVSARVSAIEDDAPVESLYTDYGGYVKYANGFMIAWGIKYWETVNFWNTYGSLYHAGDFVVPFGVTFAVAPIVIMNADKCSTEYYSSSTTAASCTLIRPVYGTGSNWSIGVHWSAFGVWK